MGLAQAAGVSVIIPTFCRAGTLRAVVTPFLVDGAAREILIVDDGSTDQTPEVGRSLAEEFPQVRYVQQANGGQGTARAVGAALATQDVLLFVDDDVVATSALAAGHLRHHQDADRYPLVVLGYMPVKRPARRRAGMFPSYIYAAEYEAACEGYEENPAAVLDQLWGGNFSVQAKTFRMIADPVSRLPYHEDRMLGLIFRDLECRGIFDRSLSADHLYKRTPQQFFRDARRRGFALAQIAQAQMANSGMDRHEPVEDAPACLRKVIRVLSSEALRPSVAVLSRLTAVAGWFRLWSLESGLAKMQRHLEAQASFDEELRRASLVA
jgi:glycosyltransferase involved in cell wall biosynthesis